MKKIAMIVSVLILFAFTAGMTFAADAPKDAPKAAPKAVALETIQGKVAKVDAAAGKIVVTVKDKEQTLTAEKKVLESVKAGDMVSIEKAGDAVKTIKVLAPPAGKPAAPAAKQVK
jgi:hypothetical protein